MTKTSGGVPTTYTCDAGDKMLRFEDNTGITTLTYDLKGNQTAKVAPNMAVTTYSYNYENKMTGGAGLTFRQPEGSTRRNGRTG